MKMAHTKDKAKTMRKEIQQILDHAQALVDATSGELNDKIKSARTALKERLESAKDEYGELEDRLMDKVQATDEFIHAKPYYAIGGTFITGLFLGWLVARK
jgi:ElaB/YqjD/DUF883 family membrane-anchored ribosome-binding protein